MNVSTSVTPRPGVFVLVATACFVAALCGTARAELLWYDGFVIGADDGAGPNYVDGVLNDQQGGSDAGAAGGIGFFDDAMGDPNPWLGVNNTDPVDTANVLSAGSLTRINQSPASTGDKVSDEPATGCCNTSRASRDFNTPLQDMDGAVYMGFLVNFGVGPPDDPHYRAVEFWDGKSTITEIEDPDNPGTMIPNPNFGRVGDDQLNMSLGFSSFGNYDDPQNDADGPGGDTANRQLSARIDGVFEAFGLVEERKYQFEEHLEWADQVGETHSVVVKFDLTTDDVELGGVGDTVSFFLNPSPEDIAEPAPSLVVPGVDLNLDSMSANVLFTFTGLSPDNPGAFDELRVGTSWADVAVLGVPEPATVGLVGLGAIGALLPARRRRV